MKFMSIFLLVKIYFEVVLLELCFNIYFKFKFVWNIIGVIEKVDNVFIIWIFYNVFDFLGYIYFIDGKLYIIRNNIRFLL